MEPELISLARLAGLARERTTQAFSVGAGDLNLGPQAYIAYNYWLFILNYFKIITCIKIQRF